MTYRPVLKKPALVSLLCLGLSAEIGQDIVERLCIKYQTGARQAAAMQPTWQSLAGKMDARRHREVADRLTIQVADSAAWRDRIIAYFGRFSKRPVPSSL